MLQFPTNVSPNNTAIDWNDVGSRQIKFTFNGDWGKRFVVTFYDYETGNTITSVVLQSPYYQAYSNGNEVNVSLSALADVLQNDRNYMYDITACQSTDKTRTDAAYDMRVCGGKIEQVKGIKIYIQPNNDYIYDECPFYRTDTSGNFKYHALQIRVGNSTALITQYNRTTGEITLYNNTILPCKAGDNFELYSACLKSPQYYFETRTTVLTSAQFNNRNGDINVRVAYYLPENVVNPVSFKYATIDLMWSNNSSFINGEKGSVNEKFKTRLIASSPKLYTQDLQYTFEKPLFHDTVYTQGEDKDYYKAIVHIVTNDNVVMDFEGTQTISPSTSPYTIYGDMEMEYDREYGRVKMTYYESTHSLYNTLLRTNLKTGEIDVVYPDFETYVGGNKMVAYDWTASTQGNYKYEMVTFEADGKVRVPETERTEYRFPTGFIDVKDMAYYITELNIKDTTETTHPRFVMGDTWKIVGDISDTTVTNNLDRQIHVGYGEYVSMTNTDVNYQSGSLTAMLGRINCATKEFVDDIELVKAWRKFITQKKPFLLKSQKGDVWVVYVSENPTTTYQENNAYVPTTLSFNWVEAYNVKDVYLYTV